MYAQYKGLVVGGVLPAFMFGLAGLLQKITSRSGASYGPYLLCVGLGIIAIGTLLTITDNGRTINMRSVISASLMGMVWSIGTVLVLVGMVKFQTPLAKLAPLYNMNTLIVAVLALIVFAEWKDVEVTRLLAGILFILLGGSLVARS
jgi:transporter family protein